ncbi:DNA repair exonuclease SbcCD ATPase subunit [Methanococcus voltae PS]|uniref:DNA repair exonuclease SbcCD ATPase subunit n=1 Tax=Methanococcus voltae PS TaxID=523842 RepID=A0ABT2EVH2_METVO|nr:hypothetical protein [Methanococcus voltae]MCS3921962.1 DNA repair exonuclease SbcCD ATPase subunit [Methanococcus voltae PS]
MGRFKIKDLEIADFGPLEYTRMNRNMGENGLFIEGGHSSGKSTTVDAIYYAIFGESCSTRSCEYAKTKISLVNDENYILEIYRNSKKAHTLKIKSLDENNNFKTEEKIDHKNNVNNKLFEILQIPNFDLLEAKTKILLQDSAYTMRNWDASNLKRIIPYYTDSFENYEKIKILEDSISTTNKNIHKLNNELTKKSEDMNSLSENLSDHIDRKNKIEKVLEYHEKGLFKELFKNYKKNKEYSKKYYELSQKYRSNYMKLRKLNNEKRQTSYFDGSEKEIVSKLLYILECPVCGEHMDSKTVNKNFSPQKCPYCGSEDYNGELYRFVKQQSEESQKKLELINKELKKLYNENKNIEIEKEKLSKSMKMPAETNSIIDNLLEKYDNGSDLEFLKSIGAYGEEFKKISERIKEIEEEILNAKKEFKKNESSLKKYNKELKVLKKSLEDKNSELVTNSVLEFENLLNNNYKELLGIKAKRVRIKDYKIELVQKLHEKTITYHLYDGNILGDSERRCLNLALVLTLLDLDKKYNLTKLGYIILDDPTEGIFNDKEVNEETKNNILNRLKKEIEAGTQMIILSSDLECSNILNIEKEKKQFKQTQIDVNSPTGLL